VSQGVSLDVTRPQIKRWIIRWIELAPRDRLSAAFIKSAKPGKHCDGAGLWFHKRADGGAQWFLRFDRYGKRCEMGLGGFPRVSLKQARGLAETAMRRGEILGLLWENIDLNKKTAFLPMTKNGRSRQVPLSEAASEQLIKAPKDTERPFPVTDVAFRQAWDRLRRRANITDLTFHDLRHEAISRMFDGGMKIHEVMAVSGHRTASQLFRYVQTSHP
jgi:integrase